MKLCITDWFNSKNIGLSSIYMHLSIPKCIYWIQFLVLICVTLQNHIYCSQASDPAYFRIYVLCNYITCTYLWVQSCARLENIIWVEYFLVMPSQHWASSLSRREIHPVGHVCPFSFTANCFKPPFINHNLIKIVEIMSQNTKWG